MFIIFNATLESYEFSKTSRNHPQGKFLKIRYYFFFLTAQFYQLMICQDVACNSKTKKLPLILGRPIIDRFYYVHCAYIY